MTRKDIKEALDRVLTWPRERQEDAVRVLAEMEEYDATDTRLSTDQTEEVQRRIADRDGGYLPLEAAQERFARRNA